MFKDSLALVGMFLAVAAALGSILYIAITPRSEQTPQIETAPVALVPAAIIISLCGETKGVMIASNPIIWTDQYTPKTPEFEAAARAAKAAREVYEFETGEDDVCEVIFNLREYNEFQSQNY